MHCNTEPSCWGGRVRERARYSKEEGRGNKRRIAREHTEGKVDHCAEEGQLEQREARKRWIASIKVQSTPPPPRLRGKKGVTTFDGFWQNLICYSEKKNQGIKIRGLRRFPREIYGNSKDDANHLWVTNSIHHPCYGSDVERGPRSEATHAHVACKSLQAVFQRGWMTSKFYMWESRNPLYQSKIHCLIKPSVIRYCMHTPLTRTSVRTDSQTHDCWQLLTALTSFSGCQWKLITSTSRPPHQQQRASQSVWEEQFDFEGERQGRTRSRHEDNSY